MPSSELVGMASPGPVRRAAKGADIGSCSVALVDRNRDQGLARRARGEMAHGWGADEAVHCKGARKPGASADKPPPASRKGDAEMVGARSVKPARVPNHPIDNKRDGLAVGDTSMQQVY